MVGLILCAALGPAAVTASPAGAADWGAIEPGVSTPDAVRARWGPPSKESRLKVEGYDTLQWIYEGGRAPSGLHRMTVDFGLLTPAGYKPEIVRLLTIEPRKGMFGKGTVVQGWGTPDGVAGHEAKDLSFFYREGLLVFFDEEDFASRMVFSIRQPDPLSQPSGAPRRPEGGPAPGPAAPTPGPAAPSPGGAPQPSPAPGAPPRR